MSIVQRDQFKIPFTITLDGNTVYPDSVDDVQFELGGVLKTYANGEITYSNSSWWFPFTAEESRGWDEKAQTYQLGVYFKNGEIRHCPKAFINVYENTMKEVDG